MMASSKLTGTRVNFGSRPNRANSASPCWRGVIASPGPPIGRILFHRLSSFAYWLERLEAVGVPSGPINDFDQVFADPHVQARGMRVNVEHPFESALSVVRNPLSFSGTPITDYRAPPTLGSSTDEILSSVGYDGERIAALRSKGIV